MDIATRTAITETMFKLVKQIATSKGKAYSGTEDVLANFKRGETLTGTTKYQVWAIYAMKHIDTVMNAIKYNPEKPVDLTEGLHGRIQDVVTYMILLECLLYEDDLLGNMPIDDISSIRQLAEEYKIKFENSRVLTNDNRDQSNK